MMRQISSYRLPRSQLFYLYAFINETIARRMRKCNYQKSTATVRSDLTARRVNKYFQFHFPPNESFEFSLERDQSVGD